VSASIRVPRSDELELLRDIERSAGILFVAVGLPEIAEQEPEDVEDLAQYLAAGRAFVINEGDVPVGYALVDIVDGLAHLEQLSVRPECGQRGLGASLLEHVCEWARQHRFEAITLTTYEHVAWNAPFYAGHGFAVMGTEELGPELRGLRQEEAGAGLDPSLRVCMRRRL
jgi:GNAT superfamily N-acetyltransferase